MKQTDFVIAVVLIALFIVAFFSVRIYNDRVNTNIKKPVTYNGFTFYYHYPLWVTQVKNGNTVISVPFRFLPQDVLNVTVKGNLTGFKLQKGYMIFNPYDENSSMVMLGIGELSFTLAQVFGANYTAGCTQNATGCPLVLNCSSTNSSVILVETANETSITYKDNHCIIFRGKGFNLVKSIDKFLYMLYGIIR